MTRQTPAYNEFRFIGTCYNDATRIYDKHHNARCLITLVVNSPNKNKTKGETNHIPIIAFGEVAEKASVICRNGARVCIVGYVCTQEYFNRIDAEFKVRTYFYAVDIMRITKPIKINVDNKRYSDLVELASVEEYKAPKPFTRKEKNNK